MTTSNGIQADSLVVDHPRPAGTVRALAGVTFEMPGGSSLAIAGPSGCGKSTLLGLLGGLALPTSGVVRIGSQVISSLTDRERADFRRAHLGLVYQTDNLLPFLTVQENVTLQLALHGDSEKAEAEERTMTLLARLGLDAKAEALPDELSGGQRQRVAVARAIVHRPEVILADEPTGALDSSNAGVVVDLLLRAQADLGATLVMVTHDPLSARRTDRVITLRDGAIVGELEPDRAR
ncbi:MAG TPA: ABC transporter ATP-binding protein [Acidimicrobiia bacterium]|nr:ABC transporter ATP-binding protein [Acidimicrobiia bacterium]